MFPFLFWFATRDSTLNKEAKRDYNQIEYQNETAKKKAQEIVQGLILAKLDMFIKKYSSYDIIIDTSESRSFKLPKQYKKQSNIYQARIWVDKTELSATTDYKNRSVSLETEKVTTGGDLTGFSVNQTSNGYSVSPEYSSISTEDSYVLKDKGSYTSCAYDVIHVKAVKRGEAEKVIEKEKEIYLNTDRYQLATKYKEDQKIFESSKRIKKKDSRLYNSFSFLSELGLLLMFLLIPLCIANVFARATLLPAMIYDLIAGQSITWLIYSLIFITVLYVILIVSFAIIRHIKKSFIKNNGIWNNDKRGAMNYHDTKKEFLNLAYANEWQDNKRYNSSKCRLIYGSILLVLSYLSFFTNIYTQLSFIQYTLSIALDILYILWIISILISNTLFNNILISYYFRHEGETFCKLIELYFAGGKLFTSFYYLIKNPNYCRSRQYFNIMEDYISNNSCEKYELLLEEIHSFTIPTDK